MHERFFLWRTDNSLHYSDEPWGLLLSKKPQQLLRVEPERAASSKYVFILW